MHTRTHLGKADYYRFNNRKKGFGGEGGLDVHTEPLSENCIVLNDLQLEVRESPFQIDALLIFSDIIKLYEIKNYEGLHQWGEGAFIKSSGFLLENPSMQLQRTKVRLEFLLSEMGLQRRVEAYVIFVNPEFTLVGAPNVTSYILPSQIPEHFRNMPKKTGITAEQYRLADSLVALHDPNYSFKIPEYHYENMKKGVPCTACGTLKDTFRGRHQICDECGKKININEAIRTGISDFRILFPDDKITTSRITDWCGIGDKNRISNILKSEFQEMGKNRGRYLI